MTVNEESEALFRSGLIGLLEIKDSDIRILTLEQARDASDKGIHIGGALSAVIPLVALYYGGRMRFDVVDPTRIGQDLFVLSKGHAVAAMASVYADLGYFPVSVLNHSRSPESLLKGHPGPLLPGVHVSTGPLGQGLSVSEGFALAGRRSPKHDVYCLLGDGELQEGLPWEAVMYAGFRRLDNLCAIVDNNEGQLDNPRQLIVPMRHLARSFESFGWRVFDIDGNQYTPIVEALDTFQRAPREGRPTVIISHTRKGFGGFSSFMVAHKVEMPDALTAQELDAQRSRRTAREAEFGHLWASIDAGETGAALRQRISREAERMGFEIVVRSDGACDVRVRSLGVRTRRAAPRDKKIRYDAAQLPQLDARAEHSASSVITQAMKAFARDPRVVSVDADLGTTSGLEAGVGFVDVERALNVGVAEANMMGIGEAFAVLGCNVWVSTFCPFFDWKVLRRTAIGQQERLETIASPDGWLGEGHGLDLVYLATAANFETRTNGATHMGNDDLLVFAEIAHLKIIDVSCPNQLLGIMRWIMEGNRGLVYLRIMRAASKVIYPSGFVFEYGRAYTPRQGPADRAVIVSSGRGVHEALRAADILRDDGIAVGVVDMPSVDAAELLELHQSGKLVVLAEQNNGYLWSQLRRVLFASSKHIDTSSLVPINTLGPAGEPRFIHSATYDALLAQSGLAPRQIADTIRARLQG
jgi:transketolase